MSLTEAWCLSVTSTGKVGCEMPHRNLLVMERTCIFLIVTSKGIVTTLRLYPEFLTFGKMSELEEQMPKVLYKQFKKDISIKG